MELPAALTGRFGAIVADPPWHFKTYTGNGGTRAPPYAVMSLQEIKNLPVFSLARREGCHLFLWATGPMLPAALEVMDAWRFGYSGIAFTWVKLRKRSHALMFARDDFHTGTGYTTRKNTELCLLGRRGSARRSAKDVRELIIATRREHSRKPAESYERVERYCEGPYLDLFGRESRPGWTVLGDESAKFDSQSRANQVEDQDDVRQGGSDDLDAVVLPRLAE